jgi:hypothetical protein
MGIPATKLSFKKICLLVCNGIDNKNNTAMSFSKQIEYFFSMIKKV